MPIEASCACTGGPPPEHDTRANPVTPTKTPRLRIERRRHSSAVRQRRRKKITRSLVALPGPRYHSACAAGAADGPRKGFNPPSRSYITFVPHPNRGRWVRKGLLPFKEGRCLMPERVPGSAPVPQSLPDNPDLDWLRKQAKRRLDDLRAANPAAQLADAQFELARHYGFSSWRALKAHIDSLAVDGQLFDAARNGDITRLTALLDRQPDKLHARESPYEWSLLHAAAQTGHLARADEA